MDCRRSACIARGNAHIPAPCNVVLTVPVAQATHVPQSSKVVCQSFEQCEGWLQLTLEDRLCVVQATEDFIVHLLEDCNLCAIHAKRVTISKRLFQAAGTTSLQQRSAQHATSAFMFAASCTPLPHHALLCCTTQTLAASCTCLLHQAHLCCIMLGNLFVMAWFHLQFPLQCQRTCSWQGESEVQLLVFHLTEFEQARPS